MNQHRGELRQRSEELPAAVYDLALRLGADPGMNRTAVNLTQTGRMKPAGAARWMSFSAKQRIATRECAFEWQARAVPHEEPLREDPRVAGWGSMPK